MELGPVSELAVVTRLVAPLTLETVDSVSRAVASDDLININNVSYDVI